VDLSSSRCYSNSPALLSVRAVLRKLLRFFVWIGFVVSLPTTEQILGFWPNASSLYPTSTSHCSFVGNHFFGYYPHANVERILNWRGTQLRYYISGCVSRTPFPQSLGLTKPNSPDTCQNHSHRFLMAWSWLHPLA